MRACVLALGLSSVLLLSSCDSRPVGADGYYRLEVVAVDARTGSPMEGLEARVLLADGDELPTHLTDASGRATWDRARGPVSVRVEDPKGFFVSVEERGAPSRSSLRFELLTGRFARLRVVSKRGLDGDGEPESLNAARIDVWPVAGAQSTVAVDGSGAARIGPVAEGLVKLAISAPGHETAVLDFSMTDRDRELGEIALTPGGASLVGRVDAGPEVRATHVSYRTRGIRLEGQVDEKGHVLFTGLPRGRGSLVVRHHRRELFSVPVEIDADRVDLGSITPERFASR